MVRSPRYLIFSVIQKTHTPCPELTEPRVVSAASMCFTTQVRLQPSTSVYSWGQRLRATCQGHNYRQTQKPGLRQDCWPKSQDCTGRRTDAGSQLTHPAALGSQVGERHRRHSTALTSKCSSSPTQNDGQEFWLKVLPAPRVRSDTHTHSPRT